MVKPQKNKRSRTMLLRLLLAMLSVAILQSVLFMVILEVRGTLEQLDHSAFDTFNERVGSVESSLENEMLQRWANISTQAELLGGELDNYLASQAISYDDLKASPEMTTAFLKQTTDELIFMMRKTSVSGGFIVLDYGWNGEDDYYGVHLGDTDPTYYPADDSDILLDVGPASLAQDGHIPLSSFWINRYQLDPADAGSAFFYKPYEAAKQYPQLESTKLGYWCETHRLTSTSPQVISYSLPLKLADGRVVGVVGVDMAVDYVASMMPYKLLQASRNGVYVLGVTQKEASTDTLNFEPAVHNGPLYTRFNPDESSPIAFDRQAVYKSIYSLQDNDRLNDTVYATMEYIKLYDNNGPFANEQWAVIGMAEKEHLLEQSHTVVRAIIFAALVTLLVSVLAALYFSRRITRPIVRLVDEVQNSDPAQDIALSKTKLKEIDELAQAIENLSRNVAESASKLSKIIDLLNMSIGAFEYNKDDKRVYCTECMLEFLNGAAAGDGYLDKDVFDRRLKALMEAPEGDSEDIYRITSLEDQHPHWLKIRQLENEATIWGIVMDVTEETMEKQRIQYERDYDLLTHLLNRRAFVAKVGRRFAEGNLDQAVFIMWDLDGLKYINDTYGHDYGDEYIQRAAAVLQSCSRYGGLVARMSGDEFYVFIDQINDRKKMFEQITEIHQQLLEEEMLMSNGNVIRLSGSAGMAWYPDDADNYDMLVKYADFAMYQAKRDRKGSIREFERESYDRDAFLLSSKEDMDRFINEELVHYAYQPIVSAVTGEIFAYEALMRSQLETIKSPQDILRLARYLAKLPDIERLTFKWAMEGYVRQIEAFGQARVFINSIPNVSLNEEEVAGMEAAYGPYLNRVVLEVIESEQTDEASTHFKQEVIGRWGGDLALDDFGAGYNNDVILLSLRPAYVKIDMALITNIAADPVKQNIVRNLVGYFADTEIKTIAEGVENKEDMTLLINMGIDYLQGYYLGRPSFEPQAIPPQVAEEIRAVAQKRRA